MSKIIRNPVWPNCPHCNIPLLDMDRDDFEFDLERTWTESGGNCPECGRYYRWKEYYAPCGHSDVIEGDND